MYLFIIEALISFFSDYRFEEKKIFFGYQIYALLTVKCHSPQYILDPQMDCRSLLIKY